MCEAGGVDTSLYMHDDTDEDDNDKLVMTHIANHIYSICLKGLAVQLS